MSDDKLTLDELGAVVQHTVGVDVDTAGLEEQPATLSELGIDSLGWHGVIAEVQRQYGVSLGQEAEEVNTLPDMVELVNSQIADEAGSDYAGSGKET